MSALRYDACLAWLQADGRLPSVTAAVARAGQPVWRGSIGADPATSYRIGSITKSMTAALVLQARDDGLLDLGDRLGVVVPESGYADATLRSLLDHTGGLPSEPVGPWWERSDGGDAASLIGANNGAGRVTAAGEYFHYSNLGYGLLGEVVARLRGCSWREVVETHLLAPLGMTATSYDTPPGGARGWSVDHFAGTLTPEPHADTGAMAPAGQLWSTVGDLLRWGDFLVTGLPGVLAPGSVAQMRRPAPGRGYALGLLVHETGARRLIGHTGTMPGFQATLRVDAASRDAAVVLANATTGLPTATAAEQLLDGESVSDVERWRPTDHVPDDARELLGVWFWGNTGLGVEWRNERLEFRTLRTGGLEYRFAPDAAGGWLGLDGYHRGERLDVVRRPDGSVSHLVCATFVYTRAPYDADVPIPGGHPG